MLRRDPYSLDPYSLGSDNNDVLLKGADLAAMIARLDLPEAREWAAERGGDH